MNERLLANILYGAGALGLSVSYFFGARWAESGPVGRAAFVLCVLAAAIGIGLDFKHRAQDKAARASDISAGDHRTTSE